jgi:ethanolamine utilization microcompartment shell protein EutS
MSIRKILGRTGLVLVALVAVVLVVRAVLNYTTGKKLEKFLAEAKAKGLPVSYMDVGPACPGQTNAQPLWKAAAALFGGQDQATKILNSELANLFEARPLDEKSRSLIRTGIEKNRRSIDLLLEAAGRQCFRQRDRRVFSEQSIIHDYISTLHLTKLLGFEALFRTEGGDVRGGLNEWIQGFRFVRLTMQEPEIINALIAISNAKSLLVFLDRIVDGRAIEIGDLAAVLKELDVETWRAAVAGSYRGAKGGLIEGGRDILGGRLDAYALEQGGGRRFLLWLARPWVRMQLMSQYSAFGEIETMFQEPYYKSRTRMNAYDIRQENRHWYERLPDNGITSISAMALKNASLEALMETARIGMAARIYYARERHLPAAAADLVPGILPREPLDPFTGKPFVFRVDKDSLLVYSLGSNEKDDGGRGTFSIAELVTPKDDDWAWRDKIR